MKKILLLLAAAIAATAVHADEAAIRENFAKRYPDTQIKSVRPSGVPGVYELWMGREIVYADETGDHLFIGSMVDTRTRANVTRQRLSELNTVKFDTLPLDKAIKLTKGKGERRIAVFSDPDCPYCKKLEQELAKIDNLTVYLFLMPLAQLHPDAPALARAIWCAADPARSWREYMLEGKRPGEAAAGCLDPIAAVAALSTQLEIDGTPAIILPNGQRISGSVPAAQLEAALKGGS